MSTSMGEVAVGGLAAAHSCIRMKSSRGGCGSYLLGDRGDSVSIGVEDVSLVCLGAGGLALADEDLRKVKRLPSLLEGPGFWPGAMVGGGVQPIRGVW